MMIRISRSGDGIVDPVIDATATQRFVQFAGAVRCQDDDRALMGTNGAALGDGDLEIRQELQEQSLELVIRTVDLVDQQNGLFGSPQAREQRPRDQELVSIDVDMRAFDTRMTDRQHLAREIPLVERLPRHRRPRSTAGA